MSKASFIVITGKSPKQPPQFIDTHHADGGFYTTYIRVPVLDKDNKAIPLQSGHLLCEFITLNFSQKNSYLLKEWELNKNVTVSGKLVFRAYMDKSGEPKIQRMIWVDSVAVHAPERQKWEQMVHGLNDEQLYQVLSHFYGQEQAIDALNQKRNPWEYNRNQGQSNSTDQSSDDLF